LTRSNVSFIRRYSEQKQDISTRLVAELQSLWTKFCGRRTLKFSQIASTEFCPQGRRHAPEDHLWHHGSSVFQDRTLLIP
jgi:hypothetical protein